MYFEKYFYNYGCNHNKWVFFPEVITYIIGKHYKKKIQSSRI